MLRSAWVGFCLEAPLRVTHELADAPIVCPAALVAFKDFLSRLGIHQDTGLAQYRWFLCTYLVRWLVYAVTQLCTYLKADRFLTRDKREGFASAAVFHALLPTPRCSVNRLFRALSFALPLQAHQPDVFPCTVFVRGRRRASSRGVALSESVAESGKHNFCLNRF